MSARDFEPSLIFDLGGVIVDHDNQKTYSRLLALLEHPPSTSELSLFISGSGVGSGLVTAEALFERLREQFGSKASQSDFLDAWTCHFSLNMGVYRLLTEIKTARPIVLCSNTNAAHWDYLNRLYGLDDLAQKAILSHMCGCEKPEPLIYLLAATAHGRLPEECLFVDDLSVNVAGAQALGFQTHLYRTYSDLAKILHT